MRIGIVGSEAAKFTPESEAAARSLIREIIAHPEVTEVCSGDCHLGGIDQWAREECEKVGKSFTGYPPKVHNWEQGYKPRNLQIAKSDVVHCITVDKLPETYTGMRFSRCYHCNTNEHVKSGGCWTMIRAKKGILHVIKN